MNARIYAALLNAVDAKSTIECSKFHAAGLNAVDFMQHGPMLPN